MADMWEWEKPLSTQDNAASPEHTSNDAPARSATSWLREWDLQVVLASSLLESRESSDEDLKLVAWARAVMDLQYHLQTAMQGTDQDPRARSATIDRLAAALERERANVASILDGRMGATGNRLGSSAEEKYTDDAQREERARRESIQDEHEAKNSDSKAPLEKRIDDFARAQRALTRQRTRVSKAGANLAPGLMEELYLLIRSEINSGNKQLDLNKSAGAKRIFARIPVREAHVVGHVSEMIAREDKVVQLKRELDEALEHGEGTGDTAAPPDAQHTWEKARADDWATTQVVVTHADEDEGEWVWSEPVGDWVWRVEGFDWTWSEHRQEWELAADSAARWAEQAPAMQAANPGDQALPAFGNGDEQHADVGTDTGPWHHGQTDTDDRVAVEDTSRSETKYTGADEYWNNQGGYGNCHDTGYEDGKNDNDDDDDDGTEDGTEDDEQRDERENYEGYYYDQNGNPRLNVMTTSEFRLAPPPLQDALSPSRARLQSSVQHASWGQ